MIGGLKVISVKEGEQHEFERLFAELREVMRTAEPGCLLYSLLRSRRDDRCYIVHEQYSDAAALAAHESSAHGAKYFPQIRALLESITVEYFDSVVE
ncbi:putative quinol monooxygenase [Anatilimnocola floriformis]|uniref:putative quinol monooxygenase n=1 Tax=Anatilimnocola floriformis TaxID=2948575 RepID=UPI0020C2F716|nr:putative quinol monooxygenase [Anatilimnocola floriformis]